MDLQRLTAPTEMPLSLEEVKAHLRILNNMHDVVIESLIADVTDWLDGRNGKLNRALMRQQWKWTFDAPPERSIIEIPFPPLLEIEELKYQSNSEWIYYDPSDLDICVGGYVGTIEHLNGWGWNVGEKVELTFWAGFGDAPTDVPGEIRRAMKFLISHWFNNPSGFSDCKLSEIPFSVQALLSKWVITDFVGS